MKDQKIVDKLSKKPNHLGNKRSRSKLPPLKCKVPYSQLDHINYDQFFAIWHKHSLEKQEGRKYCIETSSHDFVVCDRKDESLPWILLICRSCGNFSSLDRRKEEEDES